MVKYSVPISSMQTGEKFMRTSLEKMGICGSSDERRANTKNEVKEQTKNEMPIVLSDNVVFSE